MLQQTRKMIGSVVLLLALALILIPTGANAANVKASGECGKAGSNLTWTLDSNGKLAIRGSGEMANYYGAIVLCEGEIYDQSGNHTGWRGMSNEHKNQ